MPEKAKPAGASGGHREITVCNWKPQERDSLRGFLTLTLPSGLTINNCHLIEAGGGRWIGLPARQFRRPDGSIYYEPLIDFATAKARRNFQRAALTAVETYLRARGQW